MRVLNLFYTSTKNTEKVAQQIHDVIEELGYSIDTINVTSLKQDINILQYNMVFVGSGVYGTLPGQPLIHLHRRLIQQYKSRGG